ncbi:Multifunctional alkaline phosphatase superfamily protein PehA [Paenibacillus allorhizoplanae]|uniref:Multifunctional alkaline phosphatase superfamily protein PehA n=1 Tax=Paenibacillus allorhizoplanae TaxID=2905648 RepID=A0ABN8GXN4_9BACL|nr:sulfatase-like hydrolase/transferase [Paenibacillus allorhizoplanae]CAH1221452.1 Multifunctional alkaline phosphatase superfamily protein PehA [Paenibacillus allorhizoplanae]
MNEKQQNILLILTDQQRIDTMKCYGGTVCQTPHLDQLAEESIIFDNAYASCPICTPARASLQTGYYPFNVGMQANTYGAHCLIRELPDDPMLLSRQLLKQDYSAGYTGKWHLGHGKEIVETEDFRRYGKKSITFPEFQYNIRSLPTDLGYEGDDFPGHGDGGYEYPEYLRYLEENNLRFETVNTLSGNFDVHTASEVVSPIETTVEYYLTERAIHYIDRFRRRRRPFFFALNFWGPHEPYMAPTKHLELYRNQHLEPWPNFYDNNENKPSIHKARMANSKEWSAFEPYVKHYFGFMSSIDEQIGRLLDYLKQNDLYDNTTIIFSADHGESLGIHGGLSDKAFFMYEETCRIPLVVKQAGPKQEKRRENRFIGSCDLYATILELSGVPCETANSRDGRSFVPLMDGETVTDWPDCVVTECSGLENVLFTQRMIRHSNLKYVFNCGDLDELYDLNLDPHEMSNLVANPTYVSSLTFMRGKLAEWMNEHQDGLLKLFKRMRDV